MLTTEPRVFLMTSAIGVPGLGERDGIARGERHGDEEDETQYTGGDDGLAHGPRHDALRDRWSPRRGWPRTRTRRS